MLSSKNQLLILNCNIPVLFTFIDCFNDQMIQRSSEANEFT